MGRWYVRRWLRTLGATFDLASIIATTHVMAMEALGRGRAALAAAFGFLRRPDGQYIDTSGDTSDYLPDELLMLNGKHQARSRRSLLAHAVAKDGDQFVVAS